jgi:mono/diheme cytochrome c family protein
VSAFYLSYYYSIDWRIIKMKNTFKVSLITLVLGYTGSIYAGGLLPSTPARLEAGKAAYIKNCSACHGETGDGNGPAGKMMKPKPRNFREAKFVNGDKPENIFKTISDGLPGTAMAPFKALTDEERSSLAYYVLHLKNGK